MGRRNESGDSVVMIGGRRSNFILRWINGALYRTYSGEDQVGDGLICMANYERKWVMKWNGAKNNLLSLYAMWRTAMAAAAIWSACGGYNAYH